MSHVFLLFGASRGIGSECARDLFARGAQVCLAARDETQLAATAKATGPSVHARATDVGDAASVQETVDEVVAKFGRIDTVINFAAMTGALNRPVWGVKPDDWQEIIGANVMGPANIIRSTLPVMQEAGRGSLLFASSPFGDTATAGMGAYCASRAGVNMMVRQLGAELQGSDMGAALIYPGMTDTDALRDFRQSRGGGMGGQVASASEMSKLFVWAALQAPWDINGRVLAWSDQRVRTAVENLD